MLRVSNYVAMPHAVFCSLCIALFLFLNQACAGLWPARAWFLKVEPVRIVSMCVYVCVCLRVCPPPRLLITSGVMWHDIDPIQLVKQVL